MDIRVLRYFLTIAREESFSRAAQALYLSQPTLSRQIRDMEEELGVTLFVRTNRNLVLTKEGMRLRKRAQEIVELMDKTQSEFHALDDAFTGDVYIGAGETHIMRRIAQVAVALQKQHPGIHYHLFSGIAEDVKERLEKGLLDFGILIGDVDMHQYDFCNIPGKDTWGLLMRTDHPLSARDAIRRQDLDGLPLLLPRQEQGGHAVLDWFGNSFEQMNAVATYNLFFNAAIMVEQGMGCALCLDHLIDTSATSGLCFRPLYPALEIGLHLVWKRNQILSPAAELFLTSIQKAFSESKSDPPV